MSQEALFSELCSRSDVVDVGRLFKDESDEDLRVQCFVDLVNEEAVPVVMEVFRKDDRIESAYVPPPRHLITPPDLP